MSVEQQIRRYARRYGIDPDAAVAVARVEGGLGRGAVGDQGTSFGPFQLHRGGALPRGRGAAWASSPAGIEYAIQRMAQSGARGLSGRAAVDAIVRNFERPAAPGAEIARALGYYGGAPASGTPDSGTASLSGSGLDTAGPGGNAGAGPLKALLSGNPMAIVAALGRVGHERAGGTKPLPGGTKPLPAVGGTIPELFYDPLGSIKNGKPGGPIGGHGDHVHFSAANPGQMLAAIRQAQKMGLHVGENPYVGKVNPVHVTDSYHYRTFKGRYGGRRLGEAIDVSGDPRRMGAFFKWVERNL